MAAASYGAGTRVAVHRSRFELERTLGRYGASDFALVEADASASIEFAMQGRFVQLVLPLPDANDARFTQTPSGRPRTMVAQERAYEQALREHWRGLLLAVRGKLQSVESGISTFEHEFAGFLLSQPHADRHGSKKRRKPKAVNWLLGSSHTLAIALVAAFLVPASAVGAFALPPNVVDNLSAPFRSALPDEAGGGRDSGSVTIALGSNSWAPAESESDFSARRRDPASTRAPEGAVPLASDHLPETALSSAAEDHVPAPSEPGDATHAAGGGSGSQSSQQAAAAKPDANPGKPGGGANSPAAPQSGGATSSPPAPPDGDAQGQVAGPSAGDDQGGSSNGEPAAGGAESPEGPTTDDPDNGNGNGNNGNHGNGNNGNGNGNGNNGNGNNGNGNQNENANSSGNSNASSGDNGNGNGNSNANGNSANANGNSGNANGNGNASNGNGNGNSNANPATTGTATATATANTGNNGNGNGNNGNGERQQRQQRQHRQQRQRNGNNGNANSGNNGNANGNNDNANGNNGNGNGNAPDPGNPGKGKAKAG